MAATTADELLSSLRAQGWVAEDLVKIVHHPYLDRLYTPRELVFLRERTNTWYADTPENGGKGAVRGKMRFRSEYDTDE